MVKCHEYRKHEFDANSKCKMNENILIYLHESNIDLEQKKQHLIT